jgi:cell division initiation protein
VNKLTPIEIERHDFKSSWRGYDSDEVRAFLSQVSNEFTGLLRELYVLQENYQQQEQHLAEVRTYEDKLRDTLLAATQMGESVKINAQREAEIIIKEAEVRADEILADARSERRSLRESIQTLKRQRSRLSVELRALVESHLRMLDNQEILDKESNTEWDHQVWQEDTTVHTSDLQSQNHSSAALAQAQELTVTLSHDLAQDIEIKEHSLNHKDVAHVGRSESTLSSSLGMSSLDQIPKRNVIKTSLPKEKILHAQLGTTSGTKVKPKISSLDMSVEDSFSTQSKKAVSHFPQLDLPKIQLPKDDKYRNESQATVSTQNTESNTQSAVDEHSGIAMLQEVLSHTPQRISHLNISTKAPQIVSPEDTSI